MGAECSDLTRCDEAGHSEDYYKQLERERWKEDQRQQHARNQFAAKKAQETSFQAVRHEAAQNMRNKRQMMQHQPPDQYTPRPAEYLRPQEYDPRHYQSQSQSQSQSNQFLTQPLSSPRTQTWDAPRTDNRETNWDGGAPTGQPRRPSNTAISYAAKYASSAGASESSAYQSSNRESGLASYDKIRDLDHAFEKAMSNQFSSEGLPQVTLPSLDSLTPREKLNHTYLPSSSLGDAHPPLGLAPAELQRRLEASKLC